MSEIDYDEVRRRVIERTQRRYLFIAHTVVFALGFPLVGSLGALILLIWILAWAFHLLWLSYHHSLETAFAEALEQEEARLAKMKRENGERMALGDDGEFLHYDDDEYQAYRG